jgi:hypothetical protein
MRKAPKVELVRVESAPPPKRFKDLARFVEEKVSEVLAERDQSLLEPFFRDAKTAREIRRLQNVSETRKWQLFFRDHGCLICSGRKYYMATGMCRTCRARTHDRLRAILRELSGPAAPTDAPTGYLDKQKLAREILAPMLPTLNSAPSRVLYLQPEDVEAAKPNAHSLLDRLVRQRVAAILSRSESKTFEPFFAPRSVQLALRHELSVPERHKWSVYFDRWGCLRCGTKRRAHGASGMCGSCNHWVGTRLRKVVTQLELKGDPHAMRTVR